MTPTEALADVRGYAAAGRHFITRHAWDSMDKRGIVEASVRRALQGATSCVPGNEPDRWKVTGLDVDGDELHVVVVIEDGLVVVTAW